MLDSLAPTDRQALLTLVRDIPRPPRALYQLLSPEFRARASSAELAELVMTEPVVAARVMAAVNSPLYGLRKPVTSLGPAITFLGLSSVRNLCLQYLMVENIARHQDAELRREFDILGRASLIASEMVLPLAKHMQLSDPASLSTQLVLSYLGRFATAFLLHKGRMHGDAPFDASRSLMQRARDEQDRLGVASGEIGLLLMQAWHLSDGLLRESRDIARILFAAVPLAGHEPATRAALGALSASLAERLARRQVTSLADYDPTLDDSDDLQSLSRHLPVPVLTQLGKVLRSGATERATA
jgi:HD-like signal output (HDOD) protein